MERDQREEEEGFFGDRSIAAREWRADEAGIVGK